MEIFYAALFGLIAVAAAFLELGKPRESTDSSLTRDFLRFSRYRTLWSSIDGQSKHLTVEPPNASQSLIPG